MTEYIAWETNLLSCLGWHAYRKTNKKTERVDPASHKELACRWCNAGQYIFSWSRDLRLTPTYFKLTSALPAACTPLSVFHAPAFSICLRLPFLIHALWSPSLRKIHRERIEMNKINIHCPLSSQMKRWCFQRFSPHRYGWTPIIVSAKGNRTGLNKKV